MQDYDTLINVLEILLKALEEFGKKIGRDPAGSDLSDTAKVLLGVVRQL